MRVTPIEPGHRIEIPVEWMEELGIEQEAVLEKTSDAILVRRCPGASWDKIYSNKLRVGETARGPDALESSSDDVLF